MLVRAIAGVLDIPTNEIAINKMLISMNRRANGENNVYCVNGKWLLSKHELGKDANVVSYEWAGENYTICFDGRLNNRQELINKLVAKDFPLESHSDEEIMLFGYICWGERMLEMVNGAFALAILCEKEGKVFLARDRLGIKPLFYMHHNKGLIFASEMKTILSFPGVEPQLDVLGINQIMLLGPGRIPGSGVFRGIYEMKPGYCGVYKDGNLKLRRYWQLLDRIHKDSFNETVEKVRYLVYDSVNNHISQREKPGTMLSGGLDSSIISAICAREFDSKDIKLETFSLDYIDHEKHFRPSRFQPNSDTEYIRIMQEYLDSKHHWTILHPEELCHGLLDAVIARDLPGMADVDTSLLAFSKSIKSYASVILSGECADELFCGYPWFRDYDMCRIQGFPWANSLEERSAFMQQWIVEDTDPQAFVLDHYAESVRQADILPENIPQDKRKKELMHLNIWWFMQTLLERGDRMGSHFGVDIRVPFCDYRIAEYLYAVPWSYKDYKGREKGLLRESMKTLLPDSVLFRKKSPFPKTHDPLYLELVSEMLKEVLQDPNAPIFQIINKEALEKLLFTDYSWPWYGQLMRRPQTIAYMLQINLWLKHYSVRIV